MGSDDYDDFAAHYDAENATSLLNAHYERPAMLALAGDVPGRRRTAFVCFLFLVLVAP